MLRLCLLMLIACPAWARAADPETIDVAADVLADKIHGGLLGQILGNLNGLPHELKYNAEPGNVESYTPALPDGARTDDDTDIEWAYVIAIEQAKTMRLPPAEIAQLWKRHITKGIWCANEHARQLMELGIEPPLTGNAVLNPWSSFNISGQFLAETFGLMAPAMPQSAGRLGLHYTRVGIDGEPAQATQWIAAMIATAFTTDDMRQIVAAGAAALDPASRHAEIVRNVCAWHAQHPNDWRATRRLIRDTHTRHGGSFMDQNGCDLNSAAVLAALLYGEGDFVKTMILAFNLGWDADCNAATAGTVVGVVKGQRWMAQQGWNIKDVYRNTTRPGLPEDETISRFAGRITTLADRLILEQGGQKLTVDGRAVYRIRREQAANVALLPDEADGSDRLRRKLRPQIERDLTGDDPLGQARAAYLAICLDCYEPLRAAAPDRWSTAVSRLQQQGGLTKILFASNIASGKALQARAEKAGLKRPPK
jgi:hypothetical protein